MDIAVFRWINAHHCLFLDYLMWGASSAADFYLVWLLIAAAMWARRRECRRVEILGLLFALFFTYVSVDLVLKPLVARPRPFISLDGVQTIHHTLSMRVFWATWSFPSGHCASSMAAAWVLGAPCRRLRLPLAALVALVAYSRVYLGMHYPSDCLAGLAVGALCGAAALGAARAATEKRL